MDGTRREGRGWIDGTRRRAEKAEGGLMGQEEERAESGLMGQDEKGGGRLMAQKE